MIGVRCGSGSIICCGGGWGIDGDSDVGWKTAHTIQSREGRLRRDCEWLRVWTYGGGIEMVEEWGGGDVGLIELGCDGVAEEELGTVDTMGEEVDDTGVARLDLESRVVRDSDGGGRVEQVMVQVGCWTELVVNNTGGWEWEEAVLFTGSVDLTSGG
ncbi:hypothetical protein Tco_0589409 [Tanacetum coccineum]